MEEPTADSCRHLRPGNHLRLIGLVLGMRLISECGLFYNTLCISIVGAMLVDLACFFKLS